MFAPKSVSAGLLPLALLSCAPAAHAAPSAEVRPLTDHVLSLTLTDGVAHHESLGHPGEGHIAHVAVDIDRLSKPGAYAIKGTESMRPLRVGRKSKGEDFVNDHGKYDFVTCHTLYLVLPKPLLAGRRYSLISPLGTQDFVFDPSKTRSEALHVNQIGYRPDTPKIAYLSHWMGDLGSLKLEGAETRTFRVLDDKTGKAVLTGHPTLRKPETGLDTDRPEEKPYGNYARANVWQLDFSALHHPGTYRLSVDGVGASYPFEVGDDVYRKAFYTTVRGLYHQRCGIELKSPYTEFTRPLCHHPSIRPILETVHRHLDEPFGDGFGRDDIHRIDKELTGKTRPEMWGGYHDAGDWDREDWHPYVAADLLLLYELNPSHFTDGELNLPESGNGIPDVVDEAKWGVDYYRRIQRPDGGVSVGLFETLWPRPGEASWTDSMGWFAYAEDPQITFRYAAIAAQLAHALEIAGKPADGKPYVESAERAYRWASANLRKGDEAKIRDDRFWASAALFRATGTAKYHEQFVKDLKIDTPETPLMEWGKHDQQWGVWTYLLTDRPGMDAALKERLSKAALGYAGREFVGSAERRAWRVAYPWGTPMWWGSASVPNVRPLMVAAHLTHDPKYLAAQESTCDFMLGGNPMNMVWVSGLGEHSPRELFRPDTWYGGKGVVPGIVPLGPYRYEPGEAPGPWDIRYAQQHGIYPKADAWPAYELWFEIRFTPPTNEFTVGTIADAAIAYGALCGPKGGK